MNKLEARKLAKSLQRDGWVQAELVHHQGCCNSAVSCGSWRVNAKDPVSGYPKHWDNTPETED